MCVESDAITKRHILQRSLDCHPPRFECLPLLFPIGRSGNSIVMKIEYAHKGKRSKTYGV